MLQINQENLSLSIHAKEFVPHVLKQSTEIEEAKIGKPKKTKDQRACPRKRRRNKKSKSLIDIEDNEEDSESPNISNSESVVNTNSNVSFVTYGDEWMTNFMETTNNNTSSGERLLEFSNPIENRSDIELFESKEESRQWLDLQVEWRTAKQYNLEEEYCAEEAERRKWGEWAVQASEIERRRRMLILKEIDLEEARERSARRSWAINAIERERNDRISREFLISLTSTNWFNTTISSYYEDYELVCFYFRLGCRVKCRRSTLDSHLKTCVFALESKNTPEFSDLQPYDYEVVCPNSVLGCRYIGSRQALQDHLKECMFRGKSRQQELEERQLLKKHVILECEEERARRMKLGAVVWTLDWR